MTTKVERSQKRCSCGYLRRGEGHEEAKHHKQGKPLWQVLSGIKTNIGDILSLKRR